MKGGRAVAMILCMVTPVIAEAAECININGKYYTIPYSDYWKRDMKDTREVPLDKIFYYKASITKGVSNPEFLKDHDVETSWTEINFSNDLFFYTNYNGEDILRSWRIKDFQKYYICGKNNIRIKYALGGQEWSSRSHRINDITIDAQGNLVVVRETWTTGNGIFMFVKSDYQKVRLIFRRIQP